MRRPGCGVTGGSSLKAYVLMGVALALFAVSNPVAGSPKFSGWSTPVNLGPVLNSVLRENGPAISKDGLSLYFGSFRDGGFGGSDIWVSQRASVDDSWGPPVNLGPTINTAVLEAVPEFSRDGHWMFFNRVGGPGSLGGFDIWVSHREKVHDDFAWETAVNLGSAINTASNDAGPSYFANDDLGVPLLFFGSDRAGGLGGYDIYVSAQQADGSWGAAEPVTELSSSTNDQRPSIRSDGLELFFFSDRVGGVGLTDLWVSTRGSTSDPWSPPVNLGSGVNSPQDDTQPFIAPDRVTLFFASTRLGSVGDQDLYVTTRLKT